MEMAFNVTFFYSAKFFNNAQNQLEFTTETRFARYRSKFSLILGIKKNFASLKKILTFYASSIQQISIEFTQDGVHNFKKNLVKMNGVPHFLAAM